VYIKKSSQFRFENMDLYR